VSPEESGLLRPPGAVAAVGLSEAYSPKFNQALENAYEPVNNVCSIGTITSLLLRITTTRLQAAFLVLVLPHVGFSRFLGFMTT
jgi:hypothetical protein